MKKLFSFLLTATLFFSLNGAARAATPDSQMQPQRSGSTFFGDDDGGTRGEGRKRDGGKGKKPKPDPTPRPRKPGPRDEGDGD